MVFQATLETMGVFFALLALGFAAGKLGVVEREFMGQLGKLITKLFLPVLIFFSTATSVTAELIADNIVLIPLSAVVYATLALVAFLIAKALRIEGDKDRVFQFAFIFGNTGFVGFPLLSAVFPETGALFMCLFTLVDQITFWTYGVWLSTARGRQKAGFRAKSLLSPNIVAIVLGMAFAVSGLGLPDIAATVLGSITKATTPLCMLYLGAMVCFSKLGATLRRAELYVGIAVKMVAVPLIASRIALAVGLSPEIASCTALYIALPVMTVVPMVSAQNGDEGDYAAGIAVATFVACVATIPLVALLMA